MKHNKFFNQSFTCHGSLWKWRPPDLGEIVLSCCLMKEVDICDVTWLSKQPSSMLISMGEHALPWVLRLFLASLCEVSSPRRGVWNEGSVNNSEDRAALWLCVGCQGNRSEMSQSPSCQRMLGVVFSDSSLGGLP